MLSEMGRADTGGTVADVTGDTQSYCTACGSAVGADSLFCAQCGAPRHAAAPPTTPATRTIPVLPVAEQAVALAGIGVSLPWQRLTASERPSPRDWVTAGALPSAQWAAGLSLKRPGLALAAATLLDFAVAIITGGASGLYEALPRLIFGGVTSGLALAADSKRGRLRLTSGALAIVTALVQFGFAVNHLVAGLDAGTSGWVIASQLVVAVSTLLAAGKTASVAFRRPA
jgi:hypothetical protein